MIIITDNTPVNVFLVLATSLAHNGEDMETVARNLVYAFCEIAKENNVGNTILEEFQRFMVE